MFIVNPTTDMPKIAVDELGNKKVHAILDGKASIICYANKPHLWQYRQLRKGQKLYKYKSLNEIDINEAIRRAKDYYFSLLEIENINNLLIKDLIDQWIHVKEGKYAHGEITISTVRGVITSLRSVILPYLTDEKKLKKISQIDNDTFLDFNDWRINHSWNILGINKSNSYPRLSTVQKDLSRLKDWYRNYLIPNGYAEKVPFTVPIRYKNDHLYANPPIASIEDWELICSYFDTLKKKTNSNNNKRTEYFHQMIKYFILVSYNTGARPTELLGHLKKVSIKNPKGLLTIKQVIKGGLRWNDIDIEVQNHEMENGKKVLFFQSVLFINDSRSGQKRTVLTNIGNYLIEWRRYCDNFREKNNLTIINDDDLIFSNPFTFKPYQYSQISKIWKLMRNNISSRLKDSKNFRFYTIYSLRNSYILNQIKYANTTYLFNKIRERSDQFINRYYESLNHKAKLVKYKDTKYRFKILKTTKINLSSIPYKRKIK